MWVFYFWAQGLADDAHRDGKRQLLGRADDGPVGESKQLVRWVVYTRLACPAWTIVTTTTTTTTTILVWRAQR